jgi:hypothetical protein
MKDGWLNETSIALQCGVCQNAPLASAAALREKIDGGSYRCACGTHTPVDIAYYSAIATLPFINAHFVCNYVWGRVANDVALGQVYRVTLPSPLDKVHHVSATANAAFPVQVAIVDRAGAGFSMIAGASCDGAPAHSVSVAWTAAGWVGPPRQVFFEAVGRAFEQLFLDPLRTPAMLRGAVLETASAYEVFVAWFLREQVWTDDFFSDSKNKADQISDFIARAGIAALTNVPVRVALRRVDLYRVFRALGLPATSGALTRDKLLQDVRAGIALRNAVAHKGEENPDPKVVEAFLRAVYFLMEATALNVLWEQNAEPDERHGRHADIGS